MKTRCIITSRSYNGDETYFRGKDIPCSRLAHGRDLVAGLGLKDKAKVIEFTGEFLAFSWHGEEMAVPLDDQSYLLENALTTDGKRVDVMLEFDEE